MNEQQRAVAELTKDPANARSHSERNIEAIMASLERFGQQKPIVIHDNGTVVAGSGTLEAASRLGWQSIDVRITDLIGADATAYAIADNRTAELAEWDQQILLNQLQDLPDLELVTAAGFTPEELASLLAEVEDEHPIEIDEDEVPEPPAIPITEPGDIWILGDHVLICGDATSDRWIPFLHGEQVDAVITDPPYNVAYVGKTADALTIDNDEMNDGAFREFLVAALSNAATVLKPGGPVYICHADTEGVNFRLAMTEAGLLFKQCLVWIKNAMVLGRQDYNWKHEPILYGWKPGAAHKWVGAFDKTTVIDDDLDLAKLSKGELITIINQYRNGDFPTAIRENRPGRSLEHPTMKPLSLLANFVRNSTERGDKILDVFGGSGSTMACCEKLGRRSITVELDPVYCDVIVARWEKITGGRADRMPGEVLDEDNQPTESEA
jgi:DNA modification methylase